MRTRREAGLLKGRALASLRSAATVFNGMHDDGRTCQVLRDLQHAFEMLLKAALVQKRVSVFDKKVGVAIGFEKCVNFACEHLQLTTDQAGTLRAIDALRDEEQHWMGALPEGLLYLHVRAGFTLFDDILQRVFQERLSAHLPHRVLPISSEPPRDIQLLIDEEYSQICQLLTPGRRRTAEAQIRIRSLLAMEAHLGESVRVSTKDVDQVQHQIKKGKARSEVFPQLEKLQSEVAGEGLVVSVRFSKTEGMPVRLVSCDDDIPAAALREVDRQQRFHWSAAELAARCNLTQPRCLALRRYLKIEDDPTMAYEFVFGGSRHRRYSDKADKLLRQSIDKVDMDSIWQEYGPKRPSRRGR
jgi:hypothetical protein